MAWEPRTVERTLGKEEAKSVIIRGCCVIDQLQEVGKISVIDHQVHTVYLQQCEAELFQGWNSQFVCRLMDQNMLLTLGDLVAKPHPRVSIWI